MEENKIVRPTFLKVLLILSFIGSSWSMFSGLSNAMSHPNEERVDSIVKILDQVGNESEEAQELNAQIIDYIYKINQSIVNYGAVEFMLYAISLIGVFLMYKNRRIGFTVYLVVQILLLGLPIYFGGYSSLTASMTLIYGFVTMIFFIMYSTQLKYINS